MDQLLTVAEAASMLACSQAAIRKWLYQRRLPSVKVTFNRAMRAEPPKADRNPVRGLKLLKENNERVRVLTDAEEGRLLAALPDYPHPVVVVALHTGMRRGELAHLEWEHCGFPHPYAPGDEEQVR